MSRIFCSTLSVKQTSYSSLANMCETFENKLCHYYYLKIIASSHYYYLHSSAEQRGIFLVVFTPLCVVLTRSSLPVNSPPKSDLLNPPLSQKCHRPTNLWKGTSFHPIYYFPGFGRRLLSVQLVCETKSNP